MTKKILIVEDEIAHIEILKRAIQKSLPDVHIVLAYTLGEAQKKLGAEDIDLILADLNLPDGSSVDVFFNDNKPKYAIPIIIMTAYGTEQVAVNIMKSGAADYIIKSPETLAHIGHTINQTFRLFHTEVVVRKTTSELQETRKKLEHVMSVSPTVIYSAGGGEPRKLTFVSSNCKDVLNVEPQDVLNNINAILTSVHVDDLSEFQRKRREWFQSGAEKPLITRSRFFHPKRGVIWLEDHITAIRNEEGEVVEFVGAINDITERIKADEFLRYQAYLLSNVSDAIISTDINFNIKTWNSAAEKLYGWQADEVIGKSMEQVLQTTYLHDSKERAWLALLKESKWSEEVIQYTKKGEQRYIQSSVALLVEKTGEAIGAVAVNRDISHQKEAELKLKQQNEQLLEIAWMQSHQVRAPVATILGLINLFNYNDLSDPFNAEILRNMKTATLRFDDAIQEIVRKTNEISQPNNNLQTF